jgi:hypothetical protein
MLAFPGWRLSGLHCSVAGHATGATTRSVRRLSGPVSRPWTGESALWTGESALLLPGMPMCPLAQVMTRCAYGLGNVSGLARADVLQARDGALGVGGFSVLNQLYLTSDIVRPLCMYVCT